MSLSRSVCVSFLLMLAAFFIPVAFAAADELTAAPLGSGTDDLIGATNIQWVFTATTTGQIDQGNIVEITVPSVNQAVPFTVGVPAVTASSSIVLVTSTSTHALGVSAGMGPGGLVIHGFASSTVPAGTTFSVTIGGINNATGQLAAMSGLRWNLQAGTSTDVMQAGAPLAQTTFDATSSAVNLIRAGGALTSDNNSKITPSTTAVGATNVSYSFSITATNNIPIGGKIGINFPAVYDLTGATTTALQTITASGAQVAAGAIATTTGNGNNRVMLTVSNHAVNAGEVMTVKVEGLTNPATAGVYRPFALFTTESNDGLIDGSYFGFEQSDYSTGAPPPNDTIYIGGLNTLTVQVLKSDGNGGTTALSPSDIAQVKVGAGCPDKQYFMGTQWLDSSGVARYGGVLDCNYMIGVDPFNSGDSSFYGNFLPPGMKQVNLVASGGVGQDATTTLVFGIPDSTSTIELTGGVAGANAFIQAYSADNQSFAPVYTTKTGTTQGFDGSGNGYARVHINSGTSWSFNVFGGTFGSSGNISDGSGNKYWAPDLPSLNLTAASSSANLGTFAYVLADKTLNVTLEDTSGGAIVNACVGVSRSGGGEFMGPQDMICSPNNGNAYQFKVPAGTITIDVNRPGYGQPAEYPVAISSATTNKTVTLSAPTSYVSVLVETSGGTKIKGAPVFANGSNGFGNAMTDATGAAKIYVSPGTYSVQGFAPGFGPLTAQTVTVSSNPSVTFTVNTGSLRTISGTITVGGSGVAGINVGAHGTGSTSGGNGAQTDANGNYTLYVPAGTYQIGGWSPSTGSLAPQAVDVSSSDASSVDWTVGAQGTLHLTIHHASNVSPLYAGAFNASTGVGNGTNSWTTDGTDEIADISLPAGTYSVQASAPSLGQFGSKTGVTITGGATTNETFDATASTTLVTLSGTVTASSVGVSGVNVWASRTDGPGFFSTQTDSNGAYSLSVPDSETYHVGVRSLAYAADQGDVDVVVPALTNVTKDFTLTAAGSTITGKVQDGSGNGIAKAWVSAIQTGVASSTQVGAPTDDAGNYTLNVTPGSTWDLTAQGPCYPRSSAVSASAGDAGKNITLTAQDGCSQPAPTVYAITDTTGGQISTGNMTINIPANALGTSQQSDNVTVYDTASNVVSSANATPLTGSVRQILVTDSSGKPITSLNSPVSITTSYDPATLPANFSASDLQLGYFDDTTGQWEPVAASIDTVNHTFTVQVTHFTEYGPILNGVPDAPTGLAATAASASGIDLSWTASPTATSYTVYRSATNSNFTTSVATGVTGTTYSDTGLSASTKYYYEVAGVNSGGEGLNSSSANATTNAPAASGGGGGGAPVGLMTAATGVSTNVPTSGAAATRSSGVSAASSANATNASAFVPFTMVLKLGSHGADVARLQELLGVEQTGYFGALTQKAVEAFQSKYGIVSSGTAATTGFGALGPKTRAALQRIFAGTATAAGTENAQGTASFTFTRYLALGTRGEDVRELQVDLNLDPDTQVAATGPGSPGNETTYFGLATKRAVEKFQLKYAVTTSTDPAFGSVGLKTRAQLSEMLSTRANANAASTTSASSTVSGPLIGQVVATTSAATSTATTTVQ